MQHRSADETFPNPSLVVNNLGLSVILLHDAASIVTSEAEGVAEGCTHGTLLRLVEGEVEVVVNVFVIVAFLVIDGGRNDVVLHCKAACNGFYCASCAEKVTCH